MVIGHWEKNNPYQKGDMRMGDDWKKP